MSTKLTFPKEGQKSLLTTSPQNSTAHVRRRVTIAGQVVNALTQQPISGATVLLNLQGQAGKSTAIATTLSAVDGWFYFLDLAQGDYTLEASLPQAGTRFGTTDFNRIIDRLKQLDKKNQVDFVTVQTNGQGEYLHLGAIAKFYRVRLNLVPTTLTGRVTNTSREGVKLATVQIVGRGGPVFTFSTNDDAVNQSPEALALYLLHSQFENPQAAGKDKTGFYILSGLEAFTTSSNSPLKYSVVAPGYSGDVALAPPKLALESFSLRPGEIKILNFNFRSRSNF